MEHLRHYAEQLKATIADLEQVVRRLHEFLELHEKYGITDPSGEKHMREDLIQQSSLLDRYRGYLKSVEDRLN